jgi:hypothetical protein
MTKQGESRFSPSFCVVCQDPESLCRCDEQPVTKLARKLVNECADGNYETVVIKREDYLVLCERAFKWANDESKAVIASRSESAKPSADTERMEWLRRMHVEVRVPAVHGSFHLFHASPTDTDGDEEPSDIREQIDYQRNGGTKPMGANRQGKADG